MRTWFFVAWLGMAPGAYGDRAEAVTLYEKGVELAERFYRYREAIAAFEEAYRSDPTLVEALLSLGDAYGALGELENARDFYEKARLQGVSPPLAGRVWRRLGEIAFLQGNFAEAESFLETARRMDPSNPRVAGLLGDAYAKRGRVEKALAEYRRELALDATSAHAHRGLAALLATAGDPQETVRHAEAALSLDPFDSATFYLLAQGLARLGRREEARRALEAYRSVKQYEEEVDSLEKAIRQTPHDVALILRLAERHAAQGNLERAADTYYRLALLGVEPVLAWVNVGLLRLRQGRREESRRAFEEALRLSPESAATYVGLAELAVAEGRWQEALAAYRNALERDPTLDQAHAGLVQTLHRLGDRKGAVDALARWVQANPNSSPAWEEWGLYLHALGRGEEALAAMEKALELDAGNLDAANNLAWLYAEGNVHLDRALELAQRVVKERPSGNAFDTLAFVHRRRGEIAAAVQAMEKALEREPQNPTFRRRLLELKTTPP